VLEAAAYATTTVEERIEVVHAFLAARVPDARHPCEDMTALVERVAADPTCTRVEKLARDLGLGVRQLQRRFADEVGVTPKAVARRYRLYEAAERARDGADVDWSRLAADLGYSDQAHLVRDFRAAIGTPPDRYSRENRPSASSIAGVSM
jgi:AraC-like DNA-binding protein